MTQLAQAMTVFVRRRDDAQERLLRAVSAERQCADALATSHAAVRDCQLQMAQTERQLWARLMGHPCTLADFARIHASRAHHQGVLDALTESAKAAQQARAQAIEAVLQQRREFNTRSVRVEKVEPMVREEKVQEALREQLRLDDEVDELASRLPARRSLEYAHG